MKKYITYALTAFIIFSVLRHLRPPDAVSRLALGIAIVGIIALGEALRVDRRERQALKKELATELVPDLEGRLRDIASRMRRDAGELAELQDALLARIEAANQIAIEARGHRKRAEQDREVAESERQVVEAVDELLKIRTDLLWERFDKKARPSQMLYMLIGVVLGHGVQAFMGWLL